jgi:hypothetical protein
VPRREALRNHILLGIAFRFAKAFHTLAEGTGKFGVVYHTVLSNGTRAKTPRADWLYCNYNLDYRRQLGFADAEDPNSGAIAEARKETPVRKTLLTLGLISALSGMASAQTGPTGPFGFEKGMSRQQIIQLVGESSIDPTPLPDKDLLLVTTAPKPNDDIVRYLLTISPSQGLLRIVAQSKLVHDPSMVRSTFQDFVVGVSQKYGPPSDKYDFCDGSRGCTLEWFGASKTNATPLRVYQ